MMLAKYINQKGEEFYLGEGGFLTMRDYSEKYGVSYPLILAWIARGVIPVVDTLRIPEFNNSTLVRDTVYTTRGYKRKENPGLEKS